MSVLQEQAWVNLQAPLLTGKRDAALTHGTASLDESHTVPLPPGGPCSDVVTSSPVLDTSDTPGAFPPAPRGNSLRP